MKNKILVFSLAVLILATLVGTACSQPASTSAPAQNPAPAPAKTSAPATAAAPAAAGAIKLRFMCGLAINNPATQVMNLFKQEVEAGTKGAVQVELYPGGQLFQHADIPRVLPAGQIEMAIGSGAHITPLSPLFSTIDMPFILASKQTWQTGETEILNVLNGVANTKKIQLLSIFDYGENAFCGKTKLLTAPADFKGLKIRTPAPSMNDCVTAWGGTPVSIAADDVYDALGKGSIDGSISGWSTYGPRNYYEVAKYYTGPAWVASWFFMINLDTWNSLPKDAQQVVAQAAKDGEKKSVELITADDQKWVDTIKKSGATVQALTPDQLAQFKTSVASLQKQWLDKMTQAGVGAQTAALYKAVGIPGY